MRQGCYLLTLRRASRGSMSLENVLFIGGALLAILGLSVFFGSMQLYYQGFTDQVEESSAGAN